MIPAERFPLCVYLRDELAARGWGAADLCGGTLARAPLVGVRRVREILAGAWVSPGEAEALGLALGVPADLLLGLQRAGRDPLLAEALSALVAQEAAENHFYSCERCGGILSGGMWHCDEWHLLNAEGRRLRKAVLAPETPDAARDPA